MQKPHYLPLALDDLKGIVRYIANELEAPKAAENFIIKIDKEVNKLTKNPYRCHVYITAEKLKHEYRVLHVNNYSIFYVAENEKIEIHRVIYSKRNIQQLLSE
jgi:plasmid stabilization system protein ParE